MRDGFGVTIARGDYVSWPQRHGSTVEVVRGIVTQVSKTCSKEFE